MLGRVDAQQQGTKTAPRAFRVGVATDHEFLALAALQFDPRRRSTRRIGRVAPLRDHAFQPHSAGRQQHAGHVRVENFAEAQPVRRHTLERLHQLSAPLVEGQVPTVCAVEIGQVKNVKNDLRRVTRLECLLQSAEVRHAVFTLHHDLTVIPAAGQFLLRKFGAQRRQLRAPVVPISGEQLDVFAVNPRQQPVAIELDFACPPRGIRRRLVHQGGQLRSHAGGQHGPPRRALRRRFCLICCGASSHCGSRIVWLGDRFQLSHAVGQFVHHTEVS